MHAIPAIPDELEGYCREVAAIIGDNPDFEDPEYTDKGILFRVRNETTRKIEEGLLTWDDIRQLQARFRLAEQKILTPTATA